MELVQLVKRLVERQIRPAQRGSTTTNFRRGALAVRSGRESFLMRRGPTGLIYVLGLYGRGRYGRERYG